MKYKNTIGEALTRDELAILWTINCLNDMARKGILTPGPYRLRNRKRLLKDFTPTNEEVTMAMECLRKEGVVK